MSKLYAPLKSDLVDPELEANIAVDTPATPEMVPIPNDLYAAIISSFTKETAEAEVSSQETRQYAYSVPNRLYSLIVPEKPSILAEERIFVYVPTVAYNSAGIAKFAREQFNIVDGEVSIKPSYLTQEVLANLIKMSLVITVAELPDVGIENRIYLLPSTGGVSIGYIWQEATQSWQSLGTVELNVANYYTKSEVDTLVRSLIDVNLGAFDMVAISREEPINPLVKLWYKIEDE